MRFEGWPPEAIQFLEGIEADNSKSYWTAHKEIYERCVREPMAELLADLAGEFGEGRIFRPYRDVRFSRDKSPYKTNIAATVSGGGYIHLSADILGAGAGMYAMEPDQLERYRRAVAGDGAGADAGGDLARIRAAAARKGVDVSGHDVLKRAPKGYPADHPRIELLRYKGLIAWREWPVGEWLATPEARRHVAGLFRAAAPLKAWLDEHVGPSGLGGRRR